MKIQFPALIVGLGKSGQAIRRLLAQAYPENSQIKTYDQKDASADFSSLDQIQNFNPKTLIVSPGVPLTTLWIQDFLKAGCALTSELDLAFQSLTDEKIIGITGSMGKSTTTSLLGAAVHSMSASNYVGGNLGYPLADYVFELRTGIRKKADWIILELSSYQLENFNSLKCEASVLTALSANHLERYPDLENYYLTKWTLLGKTKGPFFINADNSEVQRWCENRKTSHVISVQSSKFKNPMKMVGLHNRENLALALSVAEHFRFPKTAISAIENYPGLSHRLELVGERNGVKFINDSKATTIESVLAAARSCIESVSSGSKMFLLVGGRDKNLPWENLGALSQFNNIEFVFFGECGVLAQKKSKLTGPIFSKLLQALDHTIPLAKTGDWIVLSPGGSSLDEFKNFEARGEFFSKQISDSNIGVNQALISFGGKIPNFKKVPIK